MSTAPAISPTMQPHARFERPRVRRRLLQWTVVCSVSAVPSFVWSWNEFHVGALFLGVAMFIVGMTILTSTRQFEAFKSKHFIRRTLYIGYITRMVISVAFPVGFFLDLYPGLLSVGIGGWLSESVGLGRLRDDDFFSTLIITLVQGVVLNILVMIYMLVVYVVQRLFCKRPAPEGHCTSCRYDLRGLDDDAARCPECGTAIVIPARQ